MFYDETDDELSDEEFLELLNGLSAQYEVYEIDPLEIFGTGFEYDEDDEHPDAKFWRQVAEEYEQENMAHLKFQNVLLIQLWQTGGLKALGNRGRYN